MAPQVEAALKRHCERSAHRSPDDLVFGHPITGEVLGFSAVGRRFKKALKAAGVREVRFHDLRHTFGTRMAASPKVSVRKLQEWMGHADITTTEIYTDYEPHSEEEKEAMASAFSEVSFKP
jgi:integrase